MASQPVAHRPTDRTDRLGNSMRELKKASSTRSHNTMIFARMWRRKSRSCPESHGLGRGNSVAEDRLTNDPLYLTSVLLSCHEGFDSELFEDRTCAKNKPIQCPINARNHL